MNNPSEASLLTVVIPCYNEVGNIEELLSRAIQCNKLEPRISFVFVNNGSTDDSLTLLKRTLPNSTAFQLVDVGKNVGYGHGIKAGLAEAKTPFVGWTHADLQTNPLDCIAGLRVAVAGDQPLLVKGRRMERPLFDRFFTAGMSVFESLLFQKLIRDVNAQPTLFSRSLLEEIKFGPDDFSLDLFALIRAKTLGFAEFRIPVEFGPRFSGSSKWNTSFGARLKFISRTLKFSLRLAKGREPRK